jgi:hypothetical protein
MESRYELLRDWKPGLFPATLAAVMRARVRSRVLINHPVVLKVCSMTDRRPVPKGRGTALNPQNRFDSFARIDDFEQVERDEEYLQRLQSVPTEYLPDTSKSIISENDSPDVPFRFSLNPYRGCSHGCSYCYARPTHEYLGLSAGLDFESKIFVK